MIAFVVVVILIALVFDYSNGFHDAANSTATIVATRVLRPMQAVVWAAFFNFVAAFVIEPKVASTMMKDIVDPKAVDVYVIFATLVGATAWNILTWFLGLPTSSSHALIGGLIGASVTHARSWSPVQFEASSKLMQTIFCIFLAPLIGLVLGFTLMLTATWLLQNARPARVTGAARRMQLVSAALYSLGHGMNDAQKTMGIIAALLISMRYLPQLRAAPDWFMPVARTRSHGGYMPWWIILAAHAAIALGTLSGGWRIVKTMGMRITALQPVGGFCAETAAAITLFTVSSLGIPVSTTHTITGAIVGVGSTRRLSAVRWGVAGRIVWAWLLTIPAAGLMAALIYMVTRGVVRLLG